MLFVCKTSNVDYWDIGNDDSSYIFVYETKADSAHNNNGHSCSIINCVTEIYLFM